MTITYICGGCERTETLEVLSGPDPEKLRRAILPCDWEEIGCVAYCPECKYFSDDIQDPCRGCKPTASKFEWRGVQKEG